MSNQPGTICPGTKQEASSSPRRFVGKNVRGDLYFHVAATPDISVVACTAMFEACEIAGLQPAADFNVVKIGRSGTLVSLLSYADFFEDAFPMLETVCTVSMTAKCLRKRVYRPERNPPILHRKELLLSPDDPSRPLFEKLTQRLEERDIRPNKPGLGFRRQWDEYLADKGVEIRNHKIVELGNDHD